MRVTTKFVMNMVSGEILEHEWYEYDGPVVLCGGGPSAAQNQAAKSQANLTDQSAAIAAQNNAEQQARFKQIEPFATERLNNGLPFYNDLTDAASGVSARSFAPTRAALTRRLSSKSGLPSGYSDQMLMDLDSNQARNFDSGLTSAEFANEQSKQDAARLITGQAQLLNPQGWYGTAMGGNQSIMNAPLQSAGIGGLLGGVASGAASSIPF